MKRLLYVTATLAAFSLLMPQVGLAQTFYSQLGIYSDQVGTPEAANFVATPNTPFNAYLVLTNPINEAYDGGTGTTRPITLVDAFECKIIMPETAGFVKLSETYPEQAINLATPPDYVVGYAASVPVVGNAVVLCTWQFMVTSGDQADIFLGLVRFPSIPGEMAIVDAEDPQDNLCKVYVSTNNFAVPVFSINGTAAVATVDASWGDVKALFR